MSIMFKFLFVRFFLMSLSSKTNLVLFGNLEVRIDDNRIITVDITKFLRKTTSFLYSDSRYSHRQK